MAGVKVTTTLADAIYITNHIDYVSQMRAFNIGIRDVQLFDAQRWNGVNMIPSVVIISDKNNTVAFPVNSYTTASDVQRWLKEVE